MAGIADVFIRALADMAGFEADLVKKTGAAGDKAGKSMGSRMGTAMKTALTAGGAVTGAVLGIAARAGAELTDAMAVFQRETGATQEELESAKKSVVELSRSNLQSFDEIARAQAALRTDLGLTQEEAEAATEAFLDYANATGRDAAEGVTALDDILDAWNLDSSKSQEIMDKLVASHQKYGGSISENEKALSNLAPQLSALNLGVDDGIELLNLFAAGGLDASKAQFALNSAIQKLPPGTSFEEFIAHLASIEDPAERARQAIEVFGARGGAGLANVLRPGMQGLDDFGVSAEEVAGAVSEASEAMKNTPLNQFKLALKNVVGPLADAGAHFAPLVLAFSQLGGGKLVAAASAALGGFAGKVLPKLISALSAPFGGLFAKAVTGPISFALESGIEGGAAKAARSGKVGRALDKLGDFMGSKLGKFLAVAFAAAAIAGVIETYSRIQQGLNEQAAAINADIANQLATGTEEQLRQSAAALQTGIDQLDKAGILFGSEQAANLRAQLDAVNAELAKRAAGIPPTVAGEIAEGTPDVVGAVENIGEGVQDAVAEMAELAGDAAGAIPESIGEGILGKQDAVDAAMDRLTTQMEEELTASQEIWKIKGLLLGDTLMQALKDKRPGVRSQAEQTRAVLQNRLDELIKGGGKVGGKMMDELRAGLRSKDPQVRAAAQAIIDILDKKFESADGKKWGKDLGNEYALGLRASAAAVRAAGNYVAGAASAALRPSSPPKEGPLHTIDKWGGMYMEMIARGMRRARPRLKAAAAFAAGGIMPGFTPPHSRLGTFVRDPASLETVADGSDSTGNCGGDTITNNLHVAGALPVETVRDVTSALRRIQETGQLRARRAPALYPLRSADFRSSVVRRG